jgi:hypothetical protein
MRRLFIILFTLLFSSPILAIDFSGSYYGVKCKGNPKCVDGDFGTGILGNFKLNIKVLSAFKSDKRTLLYVAHNNENNTISIFFSDHDLNFFNMPLNGDQFEGKDDKSGNSTISGSFLDDVVTLTYKKFAGATNEIIFHYKAKLTDTEQSRRVNIEVIEDNERNIDRLEDTVINKNNKIDGLENDVSKKKNEIKKLKSDLNKKENELADTIIEKDSEIEALIDNHNTEIASLKNKKNNEITSLKKKKNTEIENLNNKKNDEIASLNTNHEDEINELQNQKKKTEEYLTGQLEDELSKPLSINPKFLTMRSKTNDECNLYTSPTDQAKIITPLQSGTEVENLAVLIDNDDWSLIATGEIADGQEGLLGYLLTDCLNDLGGEERPEPPPGDDNEKISITFPKWDKGKKGRRISIDAPGFISIKGRVNVDSGIIEVQLNGEPVDGVSSNGNFETFFIARTGDNEMTLKVIDKNNDTHELNFIIATK